MQNYDRAYKRLFAHPEMVIHLLCLIEQMWVEELDWSTLERVNTVLVAGPPLERAADMVWRIRLKGRQIDVYLILEFRTSPDRDMPIRMLAYVVLLYQELIREKVFVGNKHPPIIGAVVYTGQSPWKMPLEIRQMILEEPQEIEFYLPRHRFVMLDAVRSSASPGRVSGNLVSALFCLEACRSPSQMLKELQHLDSLLKEPGREELRRSFADWLYQAYLPSRLGRRFPEFEEIDIEEVSKMIELREDAWCLQWKKEGFEEGERKGRIEGERRGRLEGQRSFLRQLLEHRFGQMNGAERRKIASAPANKLLQWSKSLMSAQSLQQVFKE